MGLDVVMVGMKAIKEDVNTDLRLAAMVDYLKRNVPEANTTQIGEPSAAMADGHRVGMYSDLHLLRGLALRVEQGADLARCDEEDFNAAAEAFYEADPPAVTRFTHLVNHSDCDGYYVPLPIGEPADIRGTRTVEGQVAEEVVVSMGSSAALLAELDQLAAPLGLAGDMGELGEERFDALATAHRWPRVAYVWGLLRWYARESVRARTLILFC